jgi:hypothetical protein
LKNTKVGRNDPCPCGSGKKWKKCHGSPSEVSEQAPDFEQLLAALGAAGALGFREVVSELKDLTAELTGYDPLQVISAAASLSSLAENHTLVFRLDALILLAAAFCAGKRTPSLESLDRWLNTEIPKSQVKPMEDPAEDFAVGLVRTVEGNRLVLNGYLSGPDAYLQDVLDTLEAGPSALVSIRSKIKTILALSNELVGRRGYDRFTASPGMHEYVTLPDSEEELWRLVLTQTFTGADLPSANGFEADVEPFALTLEELRRAAPESRIGGTRPKIFLRNGDTYLLIFPTAAADSVILFTLRELARLNMIRGFNNNLNRRQAGRIFEDAGRHFGQENVVTNDGDLNSESRPQGLSEVAFRFDHNRYFHLVILHDDMRGVLEEGLDETRWPDPSVADHIQKISSVLAKRPGCVGGFTLIVMVGVGRPYQVAAPRTLPSGWSLQVWSLFDFERLQWLERDWERMLWKVSQQRETLSALQIEFVSPDDATLYASWMNEDYRLIPGAAVEPGQVLVNVSCGEVFNLREKARLRLDTHAAYRPDSRTWVTICRINPLSYFKDDLLTLRYGAPDLAAHNFLAGAVATKERTWWLDCAPSKYPDADRLHMFKVWETALIWLERVVTVAEQQLLWEPQRNPIVTLDLSDIAAMKDWNVSTIEAVAPVSAFETELDKHGFTIKVPAAFVSMGRSPQNFAERLFAKAFVFGASCLGGKRLSDAEVEQAIESLQISPDERHMHTLVATDHRDYLRDFGQRDFELTKDADIHFADAGIGYEAGISEPTVIEDREQCKEFLNSVVDAFWARGRRRLESIDRRSLVVRCLRNNEAVLAEQDAWTRTRRAVAALHKDQADVLSASQIARQKMDRTQISHRLLIEMAICTCPEVGGREATQEDIDYLGAQILQMVATAQESDAMRAGAIPAWVRVALAGDVRLSSDFSDLMRPYLFSHFEVTHRRDIHDYERYLSEPRRGTKTEDEVFGRAFIQAFLGEYGISPARLADMATVLAQDAYEQQVNIVVRSIGSLQELLRKAEFSQAEVDNLLQKFLLPARLDWTKVSAPFRSRDWWPWRYRRHLSVMTRPLVGLNNSEVAYAPAFCDDSFRHVVMEAYTGASDTEYFTSSAMKKYIGAANAKRGIEFNKAAAAKFSEGGWTVWTEVEMNRLLCPREEASGDIDVIAVKDGIVYLCECKDLSFARTITEVVEQLGRFQGKHGDDLWKHLRRVKWVQQNASKLRQVVGQEPVEVHSLLITSKIVPMQYSRGFLEQVVPIDALQGLLAEGSVAAARPQIT